MNSCGEIIIGFIGLMILLALLNILFKIGVVLFWIGLAIAVFAICLYGIKYLLLLFANIGLKSDFIYDNLPWFETESDVLEENGFTFVDYIANGRECPGKQYYCTSKHLHAKIILQPRLNISSFKTKVIFTEDSGEKTAEIKYRSNINPDTKRGKIIKILKSI